MSIARVMFGQTRKATTFEELALIALTEEVGADVFDALNAQLHKHGMSLGLCPLDGHGFGPTPEDEATIQPAATERHNDGTAARPAEVATVAAPKPQRPMIPRPKGAPAPFVIPEDFEPPLLDSAAPPEATVAVRAPAPPMREDEADAIPRPPPMEFAHRPDPKIDPATGLPYPKTEMLAPIPGDSELPDDDE